MIKVKKLDKNGIEREYWKYTEEEIQKIKEKKEAEKAK